MSVVRLGGWAGVAAALALAAGCALVAPRPAVDDPQATFAERVAAMRQVETWALRGRLAIRTRERGESVNLVWRHDGGARHYINLYGPLGSGRVVLTADADGAMLRDSKGGTHRDASAEALLYRVAGWRVPFESLQYWVLGIPAPDGPLRKELDGWGRLSSLVQGGWRIEFPEYHVVDGRYLPRKLVMRALPGTRHVAGDGAGQSVQVKALIEDWDWQR